MEKRTHSEGSQEGGGRAVEEGKQPGARGSCALGPLCFWGLGCSEGGSHDQTC